MSRCRDKMAKYAEDNKSVYWLRNNTKMKKTKCTQRVVFSLTLCDQK